MPRLNIVVLDRLVPGAWAYILWADVPAARQAFYASAGAKSAWRGALASDLVALQNGSVTEASGLILTPGFTTPQLQAELQARWGDFQAQINATNPWNFYGTTWDGVTWTVAGAG